MQTFLFLKLSIVRHFTKATIHTKKATLEEIFCFQMLFQGMVERTNHKPLTLTR